MEAILDTRSHLTDYERGIGRITLRWLSDGAYEL